ncbi:homoserine dehydrogenase [Streptomyces sp. NL15-2K]|nr:homoserine dehydrogenase [Streptomyces sp. NL15-2K]
MRQERRQLPRQRDRDLRHPAARRHRRPRRRRDRQGPRGPRQAGHGAPRGAHDTGAQPAVRHPRRGRPARRGLLHLLDQQRRAAHPRPRRPLPATATARHPAQPLRLLRGQRRQPRLAGRRRRHPRRHAHLEQPGVRPGPPSAPRPGRRPRGAVHRGHRPGPRLRRPPRTDRGALRPQPLHALRTSLPHRRPGPLDRRRHPRTPRPRRRPGEGARLSHRTRRGRGGPARPPRRLRERRRGPRGPERLRPARRIRRPGTRPGRTGRPRAARPRTRHVALLHGALGVRHHGPAAAHHQRQARPPRAARTPVARDRRLRRAAHRHRGGAGRDLDGGAGRRTHRRRGRLLRPRRPFAARHPCHQPHPHRARRRTLPARPVRSPPAGRRGGSRGPHHRHARYRQRTPRARRPRRRAAAVVRAGTPVVPGRLRPRRR